MFTKATGAKNTSTDAEIEEEIRLAWNKVYMDSYLNSATDKANALKTELEKNGHTVEDVSVNGDKITITNYREKNKIVDISIGTVEDNKPTLADVTKDNYGDYIDLGQNVVGTEATTDDWRILYNDKNGHVYAILADYLLNTNEAIEESGLLKGNNKIYNIYGNTAAGANKFIDKLNNTTAWQSLIPDKLQNKCQVTGATTANILLASYNEKYETNLTPIKKGTTSVLRTNPSDDSSPIDTLYMPHESTSENCYGYWLASISYAPENKMYAMTFRGTISGNYNQSSGDNAVCPVVSLPSDLQVTKNGTVWKVVQ